MWSRGMIKPHHFTSRQARGCIRRKSKTTEGKRNVKDDSWERLRQVSDGTERKRFKVHIRLEKGLCLTLCGMSRSSQEPDAKRQRIDDGSAAAVSAMTDAQANSQAYNYNWYQVGLFFPAVDTFASAFHASNPGVINFCSPSILVFLQQQYSGWGQNSWGQYNQYAQYSQYYPPPPTWCANSWLTVGGGVRPVWICLWTWCHGVSKIRPQQAD